MKTRIFSYMSVTLIILFIVSCSQFEISEALRRGVRFSNTEMCYSKHKRTIDIEFSFPYQLHENKSFRKSKWLLFSREFESIAEVKQYIIDNFAEDADISFVFHTDKVKVEQTTFQSVSLNYQKTEKNFAHQVRSTQDDEPWLFSVPFTVPDEILSSQSTVYGSIMIKHNKIDEYVFSNPIEITYESCCGKTETQCPPGYKFSENNCDCVKIEVPKTQEFEPPTEIQFKPIIQFPLIANGTFVPGSPVKIEIIIDGKAVDAWLYPTDWDISKYKSQHKGKLNNIFQKGQFFFPLCKWTLDDLVDLHSDFYKQTWTPLISEIYKDLEKLEDTKNHFALLIQGSADGGTNCKGISEMDQMERNIYDMRPFCFYRENFQSQLTVKGQPRYSNPVQNDNLPNLRASFIKWAMQRSIVGDSHIGIIDGLVIPGLNPKDRKVVTYILQTPINISDQYGLYFQ